jgi:hypothetical protein
LTEPKRGSGELPNHKEFYLSLPVGQMEKAPNGLEEPPDNRENGSIRLKVHHSGRLQGL